MARTRKTISIEDKIDTAQQKVISTKEKHDAAVAELRKLYDKRDAMRKDELMDLFIKSNRSYYKTSLMQTNDIKIATQEVFHVVDVYLSTGSVNKTAEATGFSTVKVRKILITEALWSSPTSEQIAALLQENRQTEEIADMLQVSVKTVQAYMPYQRGIYGLEEKSGDAVRSQAYRDRMKEAAVHQVKGSPDGAKIIPFEMLASASEQPICLRLTLTGRYGLTQEESDVLRAFGGSESGSVFREIVIPPDMTLHALHYAIQRLFGWQNSHLRNFSLPDGVFERLVQDDFHTYVSLCGDLFLFPLDADSSQDMYWDDDYKEGKSFQSWLKKKYTGPYARMGACEEPAFSRAEAAFFSDRWNRLREKHPDLPPLEHLKLSEINEHMIIEQDFNYLLERLPVTEILDRISDHLIYLYDYGDDWHVHMSLADMNNLPQDALQKAMQIVEDEYRPVCITRDGMNVLDDVGGIYGFCDFLKTINGDDADERESLLVWAKSLGWSKRRIRPERCL